MTYKEFHTAFNIQLDKAESISHPAFLSKEKDYWINTAIRNLVKTRFSGNNPLRKGFQQDQKRTDDLRFLVKTCTYKLPIYWSNTVTYSTDDIVYYSVDKKFYKSTEDENLDEIPSGSSAWSVLNNYKELFADTVYYAEYPTNYWFGVGENINVYKSINNVNTYLGTFDIIECTVDNITSHINNSLSDYHLRNNRAKPLRWISDGQIYIYKDTDYNIDNYQLVYLTKPQVFERISTGENYNEDTEYTGMPEHLHDEIVAYAVRLALGSIGDERYQIQSAENQIIE